MHREVPMLPNRETESIEFKKTLSELKEGVISLTSMLNKGGVAHLYFGIKNDGTMQTTAFAQLDEALNNILDNFNQVLYDT